MKRWNMIHKIKALHNEGSGMSIRGITRQLGISRNTVRKYLAMSEEEIQARQSNRERRKLLDPHRDYIRHLMESFPGLSAVKIHHKLKEKHPDLPVSIRTVRRYVAKLKQTSTLRQERYYEPVLDMVPGVQCQVDPGELRGVLVAGRPTTVYFVVFVLSYSRLMYVGLSHRPIGTGTFIRMHDAAFRYFGGRPEECVYDQTRLVVIEERYRELTLNEQFHGYATAAGFRIRACEGYDPESKGKVEAGVRYVKGNALAGERFSSWSDLEAYMAEWLEATANARDHGSTGEPPRQRYERDERSHMRPYLTPAIDFTPTCRETRKADKTGLVSWKSNRYSVPMRYQRATLGVREEQDFLILIDLETGEEVTRHALCHGRGQVIKKKSHYRDKARRIADFEAEIQRRLGDDGSRLSALLKKGAPDIYKDQLAGLIRLLDRHEIPAPLLAHLLAQPRLTTSRIEDYLDAYRKRPELLDELTGRETGERPASAADGATMAMLRPYAAVCETREVSDAIH